ncbi:DUF6344 domain-containing protein [Streptomyces sp. NPDC004629]|uniref:DUF6344 domain-containing protein n=1 Tax=Streptomyces sp. NPDC004629 TaxID=3364705 RepID=UPI0036A5D66F
MARNNKVMNLWTVIVTAFLALFAALGLASSATAAAAPQTEAPQKSSAPAPTPATHHWSWTRSWSWSEARALPPTMKQRIRAEAHGTSPSCRHSPLEDTAADILRGLAAPAPLTC